jgi:hypothetical protein
MTRKSSSFTRGAALAYFSPVEDVELRRKLDDLAQALRPLHRLLIEVVKHEYEKSYPRIEGPVQLFNLVTRDPFFAWLLPLSALMAAVDELYDQKEPIDPAAAKALRVNLEALVSDGGTVPAPESFVARYLAVLQEVPEVVLAHARLRRALDAIV